MSFGFVTLAPKTLAFCGSTLVLMAFGSALVQANKKGKAGLRVAEDLKMMGEQSSDPEAVADAERWTNIVNNNTENLPFFLFVTLFCAFSVAAAGRGAARTYAATTIIYTLCRIAWTYAYAYALQPFRTIAFLGAQIMMLIQIILIFVAIF
eukprot:TRINITY_DN6020_c0_g1_i1.p1 TRINITY_DN6020_c0_g1~~TRINITY_DN6020_c0_g1_i1.p1  ORF type:complete len:165 (+),score=8.30 TRINITY_DN6020_c0_g1_i1:44-496(+)